MPRRLQITDAPVRTRFFLSLLIGLLTAAPIAAAAQEGQAPLAAAGRSLQLEVILNGRPRNLIAEFVLGNDGRLASTRAELEGIGVRAPGQGDPQEEIALADIDGLTYDYDEPAQKIRLTLAQGALAERVYEGLPTHDAAQPSSLEASLGGVLNYHLRTSVMKDPRGGIDYQGGSILLDGRVFSEYGTVKSGAIVGSTLANRFTQVRLDTNWTYADPERMINYVVGDTITSGPAWARPARLGGVQAQRNFGLRPDLITAALPSISGSAAAPTTVDVYVSNTLTLSQPVDEGPYRISGIPVSGNGTTRIVTRDATGRIIETATPFVVSSKILRKGLWDWSFEAGFPRQYYALQSDHYARTAVASGSLRGGVADWATLEAHGETSSSGLGNASAGANLRILDRAVMTLAGGASYWRGDIGALVYGSLETRLFGVTVSLSSQRTFGLYNDLVSVTSPNTNVYGQFLSLSFPYNYYPYYPTNAFSGGSFQGYARAFYNSQRPARALDRASISFPLPLDDKTMINIALANVSQGPGALNSQMVSVGATRTFFDSITGFVAVTYDFKNPWQRSVFAGFSMPLGKTDGSSISSSFAMRDKNPLLMVDAGRTIGQEPGAWGWRVRNAGLQGSGAYREASLGYRHEYGRVEAGASQMGRRLGGYAEAEGALAAIWGAGVGLGNRISDAFALVNAGAPDVLVLSENRPVGRTNMLGTLLVPNLRAFEQNRLAIDVKSLPIDRMVAESEHVVRPARGAGVAVDFAGKRRQSGVVVIVRDEKGAFLPAGTRVTVANSGEALIVGYDGRLWAPNPEPENELVASLGMNECRAQFSYPPESGKSIPVVCR